MPDIRIAEPEPTITDAFATLPLEAPDRSAWPALAARIDGTPPSPRRGLPPRRWLLAIAAAAALATVALMPRSLHGPDGSPSPPADRVADVAAPADRLETLMAESARLEHLLRAVAADGMASGNATALALEYESRVQQIDATLSDPTLAAADRTALWHRRVELLREYAGVQGTAQWLAAQGGAFDGDLVAVF